MSYIKEKGKYMKTLYFDCSSGISGNMVLGALLEIVGDTDYFLQELKKLKLNGYHIEISSKIKNGITATYVDVVLENEHHSHEEKHHHDYRNLQDIETIIDHSELENECKLLAKRIFQRVAKAESKVHHKPIEEVHFHEVGAIDSIIDIVGTAILIQKIHPDQIISSIVNDGHGFITCAHGTLAVPVPATCEIFADSDVIVKQIDIETELVTPTGAAIIAELATQFTTLPAISIQTIGWGSGFKELAIPNVLKVYWGEIQDKKQEIMIMETNIDDCSGEILGYTIEKLLQNGALDVFYTPIFMKKNRPGYCLSVICKPDMKDILQDIIFSETTTIGIRYTIEERTELPREIVDIETEYGTVKAKKILHQENTYLYPEYESIKKLAMENNMPLKACYSLPEFKK